MRHNQDVHLLVEALDLLISFGLSESLRTCGLSLDILVILHLFDYFFAVVLSLYDTTPFLVGCLLLLPLDLLVLDLVLLPLLITGQLGQ